MKNLAKTRSKSNNFYGPNIRLRLDFMCEFSGLDDGNSPFGSQTWSFNTIPIVYTIIGSWDLVYTGTPTSLLINLFLCHMDSLAPLQRILVCCVVMHDSHVIHLLKKQNSKLVLRFPTICRPNLRTPFLWDDTHQQFGDPLDDWVIFDLMPGHTQSLCKHSNIHLKVVAYHPSAVGWDQKFRYNSSSLQLYGSRVS